MAPLWSDNELYLRTVHLRTTMPVLAVMLLTNKAIKKRHSAADLIFSGQIYFYLITMGCILMGNVPNFYFCLFDILYIFFATLLFPRPYFSACTCTRITTKLFYYYLITILQVLFSPKTGLTSNRLLFELNQTKVLSIFH